MWWTSCVVDEGTTMKAVSYVHEGTEVKLTGRIAQRELTSRRGSASKVDELVEITPVDDEVGSWKKFVREKELYILTDSE